MRPVHSVLLASLLVGCGAGATESPAPKTSPKATAAATVAPLPSAPYTLKRSQVKEALKGTAPQGAASYSPSCPCAYRRSV